MTPRLNQEQSDAIYSIVQWLNEEEFDPFFLLEGSAGTGKTFCIQELIKNIPGEYIFTAPTNKATKVLRDTVTRDDYQPECRTIYSLLQLRLQADGEFKKLKVPEKPVDLRGVTAVIVDEAYCIPANLYKYIETTAYRYNVRFLFMGDGYQWTPIGEDFSLVRDVTRRAMLIKVMRHDNAILELATRIRDQIGLKRPRIDLVSNNDGNEGVWKLNKPEFMSLIKEHALSGKLSDPAGSKIIAWRNVQVDAFNAYVREAMFGKVEQPWSPGDRVIFTAHAKGNYDEVIAHTDDEGTVLSAYESYVGEFRSWQVQIKLDDDRIVDADMLHADGYKDFNRELEDLRTQGKWKHFWALKELFHQLKHSWAMTSHRMQGTTIEDTFLCHQDIFQNQNIVEAYRGLYVGSTRSRKRLFLS